jgi:hypothetical protein
MALCNDPTTGLREFDEKCDSFMKNITAKSRAISDDFGKLVSISCDMMAKYSKKTQWLVADLENAAPAKRGWSPISRTPRRLRGSGRPRRTSNLMLLTRPRSSPRALPRLPLCPPPIPRLLPSPRPPRSLPPSPVASPVSCPATTRPRSHWGSPSPSPCRSAPAARVCARQGCTSGAPAGIYIMPQLGFKLVKFGSGG